MGGEVERRGEERMGEEEGMGGWKGRRGEVRRVGE